jgi:hypothetical protein
VESPLASHVKAQIAAVLAPAVLTPDRSSSLPQRTLTTGSHAAFAMGSTGVTPGARPVPDPSVLAPAVASEPRGTKRWMGASAAAATVAVFVVAGMVATSTSSELGAGAARAVALKSVTAKTFAGEPPTTMRAVPVTASESAPVGRARTVASKPPPVAPAAVTVAPAPAPASTPPPARPATPAKSANPLEDRQ